MNIVSINTLAKAKEDVASEEQKKAMLEVLDFMRKSIESGDIKEFVACSIGEEGIAQIHVAAMDLPGSIGLFEIGKHLLIANEA